jgi:hypothetical protein
MQCVINGLMTKIFHDVLMIELLQKFEFPLLYLTVNYFITYNSSKNCFSTPAFKGIDLTAIVFPESISKALCTVPKFPAPIYSPIFHLRIFPLISYLINICNQSLHYGNFLFCHSNFFHFESPFPLL